MKQKIQDIIIKRTKQAVKAPLKVRRSFAGAKEEKSGKGGGKGKFIFGILVFVMVLVLGTKVVDALSKAVIQVVLHEETVNVDTVLRAGNINLSDLSFETAELQITDRGSAKATSVKTVETKASGQIVIYNAYSSSPQPLIAGTRFETPDGKIYRISQKLTVPGAKVVNGQTEPSSVETTVYADEAGEAYNIGLTDFTIPGFKDGPRYDKFYARSKTPMSGGMKGEVPVVSEEDYQKLQQALEKSIRNQLTQKAVLQTPKNFLLYDGAMAITFSKNEAEQNTGNTAEVVIQETGTLYAYLIPKDELSRVLAVKYLGEELKDKVAIKNPEQLVFTLINEDKGKGALVFQLRGTINFIWLLDQEHLKESLIASSKNLESVFKNFPEIDRANIIFKPFWWKFFPDKVSKINIESIEN